MSSHFCSFRILYVTPAPRIAARVAVTREILAELRCEIFGMRPRMGSLHDPSRYPATACHTMIAIPRMATFHTSERMIGTPSAYRITYATRAQNYSAAPTSVAVPARPV